MSSLHTRCGTIPMSSAFIVSMEKRISTRAMSLRAFARSRRRTLIAMEAPEIDWAKTRTSASMLAGPNSALVIPAASMLSSIAGADRPSLRATSQPATPMSSVSATASTATPSARKPMWRCCVDCTVPRPSYPSQRACHPVLIVFRFGIPAVRRTGRRQELRGAGRESHEGEAAPTLHKGAGMRIEAHAGTRTDLPQRDVSLCPRTDLQ